MGGGGGGGGGEKPWLHTVHNQSDHSRNAINTARVTQKLRRLFCIYLLFLIMFYLLI